MLSGHDTDIKITSILLWTQDNTLSEKFYKKVGFDLIKSDDQHSVMQLGDTQIVLVSMRDDEEFNRDSLSGDKGQGMYIYIHVDDVDATYAQFKQKGVQPTTKPRDWPWGNREFIVKDPDGFKLCFWHKS